MKNVLLFAIGRPKNFWTPPNSRGQQVWNKDRSASHNLNENIQSKMFNTKICH